MRRCCRVLVRQTAAILLGATEPRLASRIRGRQGRLRDLRAAGVGDDSMGVVIGPIVLLVDRLPVSLLTASGGISASNTATSVACASVPAPPTALSALSISEAWAASAPAVESLAPFTPTTPLPTKVGVTSTLSPHPPKNINEIDKNPTNFRTLPRTAAIVMAIPLPALPLGERKRGDC